MKILKNKTKKIKNNILQNKHNIKETIIMKTIIKENNFPENETQ